MNIYMFFFFLVTVQTGEITQSLERTIFEIWWGAGVPTRVPSLTLALGLGSGLLLLVLVLAPARLGVWLVWGLGVLSLALVLTPARE